MGMMGERKLLSPVAGDWSYIFSVAPGMHTVAQKTVPIFGHFEKIDLP